MVVNYNYPDARDFYEGRAVVQYNNRYGAFDSQGNMIIPNTYAVLGNFSEGKACAGGYNAWLGYIYSLRQLPFLNIWLQFRKTVNGDLSIHSVTLLFLRYMMT